MSDLFAKGTAIGFDYKTWKEDEKLFSSLLLSVLQTWLMTNYDSKDHLIVSMSNEQERIFGKIKTAFWGFEGDIHNLAVNYHFLVSQIENNDNSSLKSLYVSLLVENYIINLRSIYDFCSIFPQVIMLPKDIREYQNRKYPDSLNTFIKYCTSSNTKSLPNNLKSIIQDVKPKLETIKIVRDLIIHKGKEPIVGFKENKVFFRIPSRPPYGKENALPDILNMGNCDYPLLDYLRILTIDLLNFMENLGLLLLEELRKDKEYMLDLTALVGVCIKDFNIFLYPDEKSNSKTEE